MDKGEWKLNELIKQTKNELDIKINHFNNIVDEDLAVITIKEISLLEEKLNILYRKRKEGLNV